jgi:hypothetical protein
VGHLESVQCRGARASGTRGDSDRCSATGDVLADPSGIRLGLWRNPMSEHLQRSASSSQPPDATVRVSATVALAATAICALGHVGLTLSDKGHLAFAPNGIFAILVIGLWGLNALLSISLAIFLRLRGSVLWVGLGASVLGVSVVFAFSGRA